MEVNITFEVECPLPPLDEMNLPDYCSGYIGNLTEEDFKRLLGSMICYLFENNCILYDCSEAVYARFDIIYNIVQNPEFWWYRRDYKLLSDLVMYVCFKM